MNVFILGITGGTGRRIARLLTDQGHSVSGLCRHPDQIANLTEMGVTAFPGDIATISDRDLAKLIREPEVLAFTAGAGEQDGEAMIDQLAA